MDRKEILDSKHLEVTLERLACQLVENHRDFSDTVIIGIQTSGTMLADKIVKILENKFGIKKLRKGNLDITFFRDDIRQRRKSPLNMNTTDIHFTVEDTNVIFVDDVLYTGRSIRAALSALNSFGRPRKVELLVLIDRRFSRDLPIQPDYKGIQVDAMGTETVVVDWEQKKGKGAAYIVQK